MSSPGHRPEDVHSERLQGPLSGKQLEGVRTSVLGDAIPRTGIAPSYGLVDIRRHSRPKEGPSNRQEHFVSSRVSGGDRVVLIVEDTPDQPGRHHNLASPVTWSNPDQQSLFVEIVNPLCGLDGQKSAAGVILTLGFSYLLRRQSSFVFFVSPRDVRLRVRGPLGS